MNLKQLFKAIVVSTLLFGLLVFSVPRATHAQTGTLEFVGHIGGSTLAAFVEGNYAYIGEGPRLTIVDVSDPTNLVVVGKSTPLQEVVYGIYVSGNHAYVAAGYAGLLVLDISTPTNPTLVGGYNTSGIALGVFVTGGYAYVADGSGGLHIIDVSTPASPSHVGSYTAVEATRAVYVSGSYAYLADNTVGMLVLDISTPASPTLAGSYTTVDVARDVYVSGNYAYLADNTNGLKMLDVSTPASPTLVGSYNTPNNAYGVYISGDYAYIADAASGLHVLDVSTPATPNYLGSYNTSGSATDVYVSGNYAYVADAGNSLQVVDVSTPTSPNLVDRHMAPGNAYGISVSGNYAYIADASDFQTTDISDPTAPSANSSYDTPDAAYELTVSGNYIYVATGDSGLLIFDLNDPTSLIGNYDTAGKARGVYVSGSYAYVADNTNGLVILDISTPASPSLVGSYDTAGQAYQVYLSGNYAYVADDINGLVVLDVSTPASPTLVDSYDTPGNAQDVHVSGSYAYLTDGSSGLHVFDISNPANLTLIESYNTSADAQGVYIFGNYAYVAIGTSGILMLDISNPASLSLTNSYDTLGSARDLYVTDNYIYVVDGGSGLTILQYSSACIARVNADPTNYYTVQAAIDAASAGDTVKVAGTCAGVVTRSGTDQTAYINKTLTLRGGYTTTNWTTSDPVANPTTLDAQQAGRVLYVRGTGITPKVEGLTVTGGCCSGGSGMIVYNQTIIDTVIISGNVSSSDAGGLGFNNADGSQVLNSLIQNNRASRNGAGVYVTNGSTNILFENTDIIGNQTTGGISGEGGAGLRWHDDGSHSATLRQVTIKNNQANFDHGGAYLLGDGLTMENVTIESNTATDGYGGAMISSTNAVLSNVSIVNNTASYYGGLYLKGSNGTLNTLTVQGNQSSSSVSGDGGGLYLDNFDNGMLRNSIIRSNHAGNNGGGLYVTSSSNTYSIQNTLIANNSIASTGEANGVRLHGTQGTLSHVTIANNSGGNQQGIQVYGTGHALKNVIVAGHTTNLAVETGANISLDNVIFFNNSYSGAGAVTNNSSQLCDPAFTNAGSGDYTLQISSCAIDYGSNLGLNIDLAGNSRPVGSGPDAGAYESNVIAPTGVTLSGPATTTVGVATTFNGSVAPANSTLPLDYSWQAIDQTAINRSLNSVSDSQSYTWSSSGSKTITLTVAQGSRTVSATQVISVHRALEPPTATISSISPNPVDLQDTISFSGSGTDPDGGSITAYQWRSDTQTNLSQAANFDLAASTLGTGTHTIYLKVQDDEGTWSAEVSALLTVTTQPILQLSPLTLHYTATVGGSSPPSQTLVISNSGSGNLNWQANHGASWLQLGQNSGPAPSTVSLVVDTTGLTAGTYQEPVTVSSVEATNSPQTVSINLTMQQAELQIAHAVSDPTPMVGQTITYSYWLTNSGDTPVEQVAVVDSLQGEITPSPLTMLAGETRDSTRNPASLPPMTYQVREQDLINQASFQLVSTAQVTGQVDSLMLNETSLPVTLTFDVQPALALTVRAVQPLPLSSRAVTPTQAGELIRYRFDVTNTGNITLYNVQITNDYLGLLPPIGTLSPAQDVSQTLAYTVTQTDIQAGQINNMAQVQGTIINNLLAATTQQSHQVGIQAAPLLKVAPPHLTFTGVISEMQPPSQIITLSNRNPGVINWQASISPTRLAWLQLNAISGTTPSSLTVSVDSTGLPPGRYEKSVLIEGGNSPQQVGITFVLRQGPRLTVSPPQLIFANQTINSTSLPQLITLQNEGDMPLTLTMPFSSTMPFSHSHNCPTTLNPSQQCAIQVTFTPATVGQHQSKLALMSNDPTSPHMVSLQGVGSRDCVPVDMVTLLGPEQGLISGTYQYNAVVDPANASPPLDFAWSVGPGFTETLNQQWSQAGTKVMTVTVSGCENSLASDRLTVTIDAPPAMVPGDQYEEDNQCQQAQPITVGGSSQDHTFHQAHEEDWVQFSVKAGQTYVIEGRVPPTSTANLLLEMYDTCTDDASDENDSFSNDVRLVFTAPDDGEYFVRVRNSDPAIFGPHVAYELSVGSPEETQPTGALILVAGKYEEGDYLQENIYNVVENAYQLALDYGCRADQIYYLSPDDFRPGFSDYATTANLRYAITEWAKDKVNQTYPLTLFMMDHGGDNEFFLNGRNERLVPDQLSNWLTVLENETNSRTNVIVEACNSGSFISSEQSLSDSISANQRVVVASTGASRLAYASAGGAVFSDAFLSALKQGYTLENAFTEGRWTAQQQDPNQTPWLDDNGNATPNEPQPPTHDGGTAAQRGFACQAIMPSQNLQPIVDQVMVRRLDAERGRGEIWAKARDDGQISAVRAIIYAPSELRAAQADEALQLTDPKPTVLLTPQGNDWYSYTYRGFDEPGEYHVVVYGVDDAGLQSRLKKHSLTPIPLKAPGTAYLPLLVK